MTKVFSSVDQLLKPDARYKSKLVAKFINCLMWEGKKSLAERTFYAAMDEVIKKIRDKDPVEIFTTAVNNVKPQVEVRSRRVGGATYQVPVPVPSKRQVSLAFRWMLAAIRKKKGRPAYVKLADEIMTCYRGEGEAVKKRDDVHKMAEANKAFAHLAY
ncbi:MAG: 30S ribosomal protein S7 [Planctomycetes bacterium]|nr:30S ribosomal protein S7 [Planctomycetota bacterium]